MEMKTVVETFIVEETAELIYDNEKLDQWNELVAELGLTGQTQIVKKEKSPIPFMHLKTTMKNVFECLCPRKVEVEAYNVTPIPVEILDLIALAKREGHFSRVQIWYDDKNPDPACIGITETYYCYDKGYRAMPELKGMTLQQAKAEKENNEEVYGFSTTDQRFYLLGKWADVKHSFEGLKEMATKRYIAEQGNEYRKKIKDAQRCLDDLETEAFDRFGAQSTPAINSDLPF